MLKNSKNLKRILSIVLTLVMVLTMLPVTSMRALASSSTVTVKAHFINSDGWGNVHMYAWEGEGTTLNGSWPGNSVSKDRAGYYTCEITKNASSDLKFIYNNNSGTQTADLSVPASKLAAETDGVLDVWVYKDGSIKYLAPSGGPTQNGKEVTFSYTSTTANSVYLAGTMNGWNTTANQMTKSGNTFTCTLELEPGLYEYKFVVNGSTWVTDSACSNVPSGMNSVYVVEGFLDKALSYKKGSDIKLPSALTYVTSAGETTKAVTWSSSTEGVTVEGTTVTLADTFTEFDLTATTDDSKTVTVNVQLYEPETNEAGEEIVTLKIHYTRADGNYEDWNVWAWCNDFAKQFDLEKVESEYIATIEVPLSVTSVSYKVRKGDWKEQEGERIINLSNVVSGEVHSYADSNGSTRTDMDEAILGTKVVDVEFDRDTNEIIVSSSGIIPDAANAFTVADLYDYSYSTINYTLAEQTGTKCVLSIDEAVKAKNMTTAQALCQSYRVTYGGNKFLARFPNVYNTDEFKDAFTYTGDDLGATYTSEKTTFKLWAPTALRVNLKIYDHGSAAEDEAGKWPLQTSDATKDETGVWTFEVEGDLKNKYYTYLVEVNGKVNEVCDPYARTTGANGKRAMVVDLDDTDPEGWENDKSPNAGMSYTDAIIYELHVRDLSIDEESGVRDEWKGKFLGLTETGTKNSEGISTGLDHMKDLGITHVHLLPSYDFGSIDETMTEQEKAANPDKQFNWGYDPVNYNVPEGSYSTNPYDGNVRVTEMKKMVQTLHQNNINVIMDVVYNHVYNAGDFCFNNTVPNYFSRTNADGSYSNGSGCGNDTASERVMVRKYIVDSVKYWADEYHIDGFRFDLVGLLDAETINMVVNEVHKTHPNVIFYGEGWTMGTAVEPSNTIMATQQNASHTPNFAYFSDTFRDFIKGKNDEVSWGFIQGATEGDPTGTLMNCFTANTSWIQNPTQVINYASCHDNYTLKDKINATTKNQSEANRIKMNNLAASMYMLAEGIPLIHAGEEMLRTKVDNQGNIIHNSYNVPDYVNSLKWGDLSSTDYQNVRDYYKGLIEFRKNHAALRLTTKTEVNSNVESIYVDDDTVMFKINGKASIADEVADEIVIIYNRGKSAKNVSIYDKGASAGTWKVCVNDKKAGTDVLDVVTNGNVTVPAISTMVLVKGDTVDLESVYVKNEELISNNEVVKGKVYVKYVDENGKLFADYDMIGRVGEEYTTANINIEGYTLKTMPSNATGIITEEDIVVTYVYKKNETVTPPPAVTPTVKVNAMKGVKVSSVKATSATLKWTKNTSATGYQIQQYKKGKWTTIKTITSNKTVSYKVTGLKASTSYKFRIRAYKTSGSTKVYSAYVNKTTKTLPSNVKSFKAAKKTAKTITLKWTKNTSADGYVIQQKKGKKWKTIKTITKKKTTSFKVTKLKKNTKYQFRIRAYKKNGKTKKYSGYSNVSVKTTKK
ncbi:MAG: type I pullulanase [Lachnospiraceae bacterium]|nr:type I pullulanase [Lachnospiraceae bacterium]